MDKRLQKFNNSQMVSGVALFSTAALSVYSIKNIIEINRKLDDIFEDMEKIKHFVTENQRKNNITAANLGKKLEDVHLKFSNISQPPMQMSMQMPRHNYQEEKIVVVDEIEDEVNSFMQS